MTGTARNAWTRLITVGTPLAETENGQAVPATTDQPAFALCLMGAQPGAMLEWTADGTVSRNDWGAIAGTAALTPGKPYYVALDRAAGIATKGYQRIGTAINRTTLRVGIGVMQVPYSRLFPIHGRPAVNIGADGDVAFDQAAGAFYVKGKGVWGEPYRLVKPLGTPTDRPIYSVATPSGGWQICS